jgi:hypothetical protein
MGAKELFPLAVYIVSLLTILLVVKTPLKKLGSVKKEPVVEGAPSGRGFAIGQKRRYNGLVKGTTD